MVLNPTLSFPPSSATGPIGTFVLGTGAGIPPGSTPAGSSCIGNCLENGGIVRVFTGSAPATNGNIITVPTRSAHASGACTVTPANNNAALLSGSTGVYSTGNGNGFILTSGPSALSSNTPYEWNYTCNYKN
jgi:hypothetical protein